MTAINPTGGEIRPCPYCGSSPLVRDNIHVRCVFGGCDNFNRPTMSINEWQNAFCWKQLSALQAENERLHQEYSKGYYTPEKEAERKVLKAENAKLREALDKIQRESNLEDAMFAVIDKIASEALSAGEKK